MPVGLLLLFVLVAFTLFFDQDGRGALARRSWTNSSNRR